MNAEQAIVRDAVQCLCMRLQKEQTQHASIQIATSNGHAHVNGNGHATADASAHAPEATSAQPALGSPSSSPEPKRPRQEAQQSLSPARVELLLRLHSQFPCDVGILASLFLNLVRQRCHAGDLLVEAVCSCCGFMLSCWILASFSAGAEHPACMHVCYQLDYSLSADARTSLDFECTHPGGQHAQMSRHTISTVHFAHQGAFSGCPSHPMLLRLCCLQVHLPGGSALALGANEPHAYLSGQWCMT